MAKFLKYLALFFGMVILASLAFCSVEVYHGVQDANRFFRDADNYTCREFTNDLADPTSNKVVPMAMAAVAYGVTPAGDTAKANQKDMENHGLEPAISKMLELCKATPNERVLNVYAASLVSGTVPVVSQTVTQPAVQPNTQQ